MSLEKIKHLDARRYMAKALERDKVVRAEQIDTDELCKDGGGGYAIDIYEPSICECDTALYSEGEKETFEADLAVILSMCDNTQRTYKVPCSWEMYGEMEIVASSFDEAVEMAEEPERTLPTNGSYVEASFRIDHDMVEMNREDYEEGEA
jgi:hypothetical protein